MSDAIQPLRADKIYTLREMLRDLLDRSSSWWPQHQARLYAIGFPRPISPIGHPRWAGIDLIAWRDRPKLDVAASIGSTANVHNLLKERARRIAGPAR